MANTFSAEAGAYLNNVPAEMAFGGVHGGRLRRYRATVTMAAQADTDTVTLAKIPAGATFAFGMLLLFAFEPDVQREWPASSGQRERALLQVEIDEIEIVHARVERPSRGDVAPRRGQRRDHRLPGRDALDHR